MIYFDNNDTTPLHPDVLQTMMPYLTDKFGNPSSLHKLGLEAETAIDVSRETIANCINSNPKELIFTSGATESNNLAILGSVRARPDKRHLIISSIEHTSVSEIARRLESEGYRITKLPVDGYGYIKPESLEESIDNDTCLVSIVHANHEIGTIQDIKQLTDIAHQHDAWFHTDAAQSLGKIPFDVHELGVDFASFNGHKLHGPKGIGALYFNRKTRPKRLMEGAAQEFDLRPGTENVSGIVGFAKAVEIAVSDRVSVMLEVQKLTNHLAEGLAQIEFTRLNGPPINERIPGNINVTFLYIEGEAILMHLAHRGICVSSGSACSSKTLVPSPVLTAIGLLHEEAHGAIRFSLSRFNNNNEVESVIKNTREVVDLLRSMTAFVPQKHSERKGGKGFYRER